MSLKGKDKMNLLVYTNLLEIYNKLYLYANSDGTETMARVTLLESYS